MNTQEKLEILASDSQYDLACSCGTSKDNHRRRTAEGRWLYPVPLAAGGYGIMFKTLLSNACGNDCRYCPLRSDANARRCTLTPEEIAKFFYEFQLRRPLLGIFLSSGVIDTPDRTMEKLLATAEILRYRYSYRGYIHLKIIPGASEAAILRALSLATAVSLNIEVPGERHFVRLSRCKDFRRDIIAPLKIISANTAPGERFGRVKCTTQFIVGASDESDREIVGYMDGLYNRLNFERIFFSAYQPVSGGPSLPGERFQLDGNARLTREHRLYQVDWLLRKYRFSPGEMVFRSDGNLALDLDPKEMWARAHPEYFPVRINTADREELLRIPGIGPVWAKRIIVARRIHRLTRLSMIGFTGKLAGKALNYIDFS